MDMLDSAHSILLDSYTYINLPPSTCTIYTRDLDSSRFSIQLLIHVILVKHIADLFNLPVGGVCMFAFGNLQSLLQAAISTIVLEQYCMCDR